MTERYKFKARCLVCEHSEMIHHESKEDYQEVNVCPKCKGAFVDIYKIHKYIKPNSKSIEIAVEMNTDKLQLKLRIIAKHAEELANELDAIDAEQ